MWAIRPATCCPPGRCSRPGTRDLFRAAARVDDATWVRGRGWGLYLGLGAVRVYRVTNPVLGAIGRHSLAEVIADFQRAG